MIHVTNMGLFIDCGDGYGSMRVNIIRMRKGPYEFVHESHEKDTGRKEGAVWST
jgi:hypothetical protein